MTRLPLISLLLFCSLAQSRSLEVVDSLGTLTIISEPSGADVYLDSLYVGKTPLRGLSMPGRLYRVKFFYPSVMAWNAIVREDTVRVTPQSETEKTLELGDVATIQSVPSGGKVIYQGRELGETPMYLRSLARLSGELFVEKEGFEPQRVLLNKTEEQAIVARLLPKRSGGGTGPLDSLPADQKAISSQNWPLYASGSTMLVSGVLSAYLKDQANREFDRYLQSRNPALLSSTRRLDRAAVIALVVSQLSFAVLSYLLLSE
jgi:hypothetical protein